MLVCYLLFVKGFFVQNKIDFITKEVIDTVFSNKRSNNMLVKYNSKLKRLPIINCIIYLVLSRCFCSSSYKQLFYGLKKKKIWIKNYFRWLCGKK